MNANRKNYLELLSLLVLFFSACSTDLQVRKEVFVPTSHQDPLTATSALNLAIRFPLEGQVFNGITANQLKVAGSCAPHNASISVRIAGSSQSIAEVSCIEGAFSTESLSFPEGTTPIEAVIHSNSENFADQVKITVDKTPPTLSVTSPVNQFVITADRQLMGALPLTGTCSESGLNVTIITSPNTATRQIACQNNQFTLDNIIPALATGINRLEISQADAAGNQTTIQYFITKEAGYLISEISVGASHTCAVINGAAKCWGDNSSGQLGVNPLTTPSSTVPVQVMNLTSGVQSISAGFRHTCAIQNGRAFCWGLSTNGRLGNGVVSNGINHTPQRVSGLTDSVTQISAGGHHTCALSNGGAFCWGYNYQGGVGDASFEDRFQATPVVGLNSGVQSISAGWAFSCAILRGAVKCWGSNESGQMGTEDRASRATPVSINSLSEGVTAISTGGGHACAIQNAGLKCWGSNYFGELGAGSGPARATPVTPFDMSSGVQFVAAAGSDTGDRTCAVVNGAMKCWGLNDAGQNGHDNLTNRSSPTAVVGLASGVHRIAAGRSHTYAFVNSEVKAWGAGSLGQLGFSSSLVLSPYSVPGMAPGITALASAREFSCAIIRGEVKCWGDIAPGTPSPGAFLRPIAITGLPPGAQSLVMGDYHACALVNGGVWCWGRNGYGEIRELGASMPQVSINAVRVNGFESGIQGMALGADHLCVLKNGGVQCRGSNSYFQLGNTSSVSSTIPLTVEGLTTNVLSIASRHRHTCALVGGSVQCWGMDDSGSFGSGRSVNTSMPVINVATPTSMIGINSAQAVSTGASHTCIISDGIVLCSGWNASGQLGLPGLYTSYPDQTFFMQSSVRTIVSSDSHSCAIKEGGVQCWGDNSRKQTFPDSPSNYYVPAWFIPKQTSPTTESLLGVTNLALGHSHTCAVSDGEVYCWGDNSAAQLGVGDTQARMGAVRVLEMR